MNLKRKQMAITEPFDRHSELYEQWFDNNEAAYRSELLAIEKLIPKTGRGIEIGVGTGRFAGPLGIKEGIDPSETMLKIAGERGIITKTGIAEDLPYPANSFDYALMVTTVCFVDDVQRSFEEVSRILKNNGHFIIGFVDKESRIGRFYEKIKEDNLFYKQAVFYSTHEIMSYLRQAGFKITGTVQTLFGDLPDIGEIQQPEEGYGIGSFVVIKGTKNKKI